MKKTLLRGVVCLLCFGYLVGVGGCHADDSNTATTTVTECSTTTAAQRQTTTGRQTVTLKTEKTTVTTQTTVTTTIQTTTTESRVMTDSTNPKPQLLPDVPSILECSLLGQPNTNPRPTVNLPAPAPAKAAGMTYLAFDDEFTSTTTVDYSGKGRPGFNWYADPPYGADTYRWDEITISNGTLKFKPDSKPSSIGLPTYSAKGKTGYTMHYGYAEARIRIKTDTVALTSEGRVGWPSFWGISVVDVAGQPWNRVGELDIMEAFHTKAADPTADVIYTGAVHDHVRQPNGTKIIGSNLLNASGFLGDTYTIDNGWHTYAALWEKGHIAWYVDGKLMHSVTYTKDEFPNHYHRDSEEPLFWYETIANQNRTFPGAYSILDDDHLVMILGADAQWPIEVDWVRIWETPTK